MSIEKGKCKGCNAEILWIETFKGKKMPCNPGLITIVTGIGQTYKGYIPHWSTCPKADEFKRKAIYDKVK